MIRIDGSLGEGGGQVVRTSLALSIITGTDLQITKIRAGRRKPGLLRQHLTGLRAAAAISGAAVQGDQLGSRAFIFRPRQVRGGSYHFAIGTAGSANLVFQTLLPALLHASEPTELRLEGGTHNAMAPTSAFIITTFLPLLHRLGCKATMRVVRPGFYPAGGGELAVTIHPGPPTNVLHLHERGEVHLSAVAMVSNITPKIASRELNVLREALPLDSTDVRSVRGAGPGNAVWVNAAGADLTETFTSFGKKGISSESVAKDLARQVSDWLHQDVPVGPHLADQLLLPMALAGEGSFICGPPTPHTRTNIEVIERFLPVRFTASVSAGERWRLAVQSR